MTDDRKKFVVESFAQTLKRVPDAKKLIQEPLLANTLQEWMDLVDTLPGYELVSAHHQVGCGLLSVFRRAEVDGPSIPHAQVMAEVDAVIDGVARDKGAIYRDGEAVRFGDVVRLNSGGPDMTVTGGSAERLFCKWMGDSVIQDQSDLFYPATLTLIRRAPEPAVPATPAEPVPAAAPKVTPADVEAAIASEHYYTGKDGATAAFDAERRQAGLGWIDAGVPRALDGVMHCTLLTHNGSMFTGESFCADLDNPDLERAKQAARRRAFDKLYDAIPVLRWVADVCAENAGGTFHTHGGQ